MIPKKAGTDVDLNAKLDEDLSKAEEKQKEEIKKSRPKLAQAVASKYLKGIVIVGVAIGIGYKMFFAPEPEDPKTKKKNKAKVTKQSASKSEQAQKKLASEKVAKTTGTIEKDKTDIKQIISFDDQTLSNAEVISKVQVPKMQLPQVPSLPTIDKIVIKEDVKQADMANTSKSDNNTNNEKANLPNSNSASNVIDEKKQKNTQDVTITEKTKSKTKKVKKVRKKVRDKNGKMRLVTEEIEVDDDATGKNLNDIASSPLSRQIRKPTRNNQYEEEDVLPGGKKNGKNKKQSSGKNLSENALDEMFVLSGKGSVEKESKKSSESKKDFILFDGASITASEVIDQSSQASNVTKMQNLENTIAAGKIIEATLETAINSETAGTIRAVVAKDVYGETGNKILIPRGSRLYGSYATTSTTTQTRLLLTWTKVIRPDGIVISMSADTYDRIGKKGIEGDIDTRYGELFKNSLLYSFVTLGTAIAIEKLAGIKGSSVSSNYSSLTTNTSPANAAAQSVISTAQDIAEKMTDGYTDDLNPVISIPQGMLLKIISSTDIVIDVAYKRRLKNIELD